MKEIGGYIELDTYAGTMLHDGGIKLNCARNALAYLIQAKKIKKILMPKLMCDSCDKVLEDNRVLVKYYSIDTNFKPTEIRKQKDEWIYLVNYYGQLSAEDIMSFGENVICDNVQAYYEEPIKGIDTLYSCRKYFGVADGAILYTDRFLSNIPLDVSFDRMHFLLGRFERPASEFYQEYVENNKLFSDEPIKKMSRLTENLLCAIDYKEIETRRNKNFEFLHKMLGSINKLNLTLPNAPYMYPLYIEDGEKIRSQLQTKKIYIPTLWPAVFKRCNERELEYDMAKNILPLPVDQRYDLSDMIYLVNTIKNLI